MSQEKQIVFSGVVTGFTLLIHGVGDQRWKFDIVKKMEKLNARLQEVAFKNGWENVVEIHSMIRFKTDHADEEEVPIEGYNLVGLAKDVTANKVICKCGQSLWRIGPIEAFKDEPKFVCNSCRKENENRGVTAAQNWKQKSEEELVRLLARRVEEFSMSARSRNCLKNSNIEYLIDLVQRTEREMLRIHAFGQKSLGEVKAVLKSIDLVFEMRIKWQDAKECTLLWPTGEVAVSNYTELLNLE